MGVATALWCAFYSFAEEKIRMDIVFVMILEGRGIIKCRTIGLLAFFEILRLLAAGTEMLLIRRVFFSF